MTFQELYERAKRALRPRVLSPFAEAGGVAAALLTEETSISASASIPPVRWACAPSGTPSRI